MPRCAIHCNRQPMQLSVPRLHDVRRWGWSTLVQVPDALNRNILLVVLSGTTSLFNNAFDLRGENQDSRFKYRALLRVGVSGKGRKIELVAGKKVDSDTRVGQQHYTYPLRLFPFLSPSNPCHAAMYVWGSFFLPCPLYQEHSKYWSLLQRHEGGCWTWGFAAMGLWKGLVEGNLGLGISRGG